MITAEQVERERERERDAEQVKMRHRQTDRVEAKREWKTSE